MLCGVLLAFHDYVPYMLEKLLTDTPNRVAQTRKVAGLNRPGVSKVDGK